jgi:hypothetical protein
MSEYLYVAVNKSMPGLLKVGYTTRTPSDRLVELHSTGVPTPFRFVLVLRVSDGAAAERLVHKALGKYRINRSREFFKTRAVTAVPIVLNVLESYEVDWYYTPRNQRIGDLDSLSEEQLREEIENKRKQTAIELADVERQISSLDVELSSLRSERSKLGNEPAPFRNRFLVGFAFCVWCPVPIGWLLWLPGVAWTFDAKRQDMGVACLLIIAISWIAWYLGHDSEKRHDLLMRPFVSIDKKAADAKSRRAVLVKRKTQLLERKIQCGGNQKSDIANGPRKPPPWVVES